MKRALATLLASTALLTSAALAAPSALAASTTNYLALGDSYPAGAGLAQPYPSVQAYPQVLANTYPSSVALTNKAVSGATTADVLTQQIPSYAPRRPGVVTLTVGADDLNWQTALAGCLSSSSGCTVDPSLQNALASLPLKVAGDITAAASINKRASVFVTGYPELFDPVAASINTCTIGPNPATGTSVTVNSVQATSVNTLVDALDAAILTGVGIAKYQGANVTYVDATSAFSGHRLCDPSPWLQPLGTAAPFHPTVDGQKAYAGAINRAGFGTAVTSGTASAPATTKNKS